MSKILNKEALVLVKKAREGDGAAIEALIKEYQGLIAKIAAKFAKWCGLEHSDLIQEGTLGLIKAVETFKPEKAAFTTHAVNHIKWAILDAINENGSLIKIPKKELVHVRNITKIGHELEKQNEWESDSPYSYDQVMAIAEEAGIAWEEAEYLLGLAELIKVKSIDEPIETKKYSGETDERTIGEMLPAENDGLADELKELERCKPQLSALLKCLPPHDAKIIQMRYGLTDGKPRTYNELSAMFEVTPETIREIEAKAMRRLRHPSNIKHLINKNDR